MFQLIQFQCAAYCGGKYCVVESDGDGGTSMTARCSAPLYAAPAQPGQPAQHQQLLATLRGGRLHAARSLAHVASCCTLYHAGYWHCCTMLQHLCMYVAHHFSYRRGRLPFCSVCLTVSLLVALCLCNTLMQCSL